MIIKHTIKYLGSMGQKCLCPNYISYMLYYIYIYIQKLIIKIEYYIIDIYIDIVNTV